MLSISLKSITSSPWDLFLNLNSGTCIFHGLVKLMKMTMTQKQRKTLSINDFILNHDSGNKHIYVYRYLFLNMCINIYAHILIYVQVILPLHTHTYIYVYIYICILSIYTYLNIHCDMQINIHVFLYNEINTKIRTKNHLMKINHTYQNTF